MLHGNPTWSFYYRALIAAFSLTHRVVAPDHMGCGLSDKPQAYSYTLAQHINNLEALLDTLKLDRFPLFLHDRGGPIGMGSALRHPERVKRFVVFNPAAFPASRIPFRINVCKLPGFGALAVRGLNAFAGLAPTMACAKRERMTPAVKAGYLAPYDSYANRVAILRFVQDIPMRPSHPTYRLVEEIGRGLALFKDHPMMSIWGALNWCFNADIIKNRPENNSNQKKKKKNGGTASKEEYRSENNHTNAHNNDDKTQNSTRNAIATPGG